MIKMAIIYEGPKNHEIARNFLEQKPSLVRVQSLDEVNVGDILYEIPERLYPPGRVRDNTTSQANLSTVYAYLVETRTPVGKELKIQTLEGLEDRLNSAKNVTLRQEAGESPTVVVEDVSSWNLNGSDPKNFRTLNQEDVIRGIYKVRKELIKPKEITGDYITQFLTG